MADRFAEVREIEDRLAAKIVEHDRQPWRLLHNRKLAKEARYLAILMEAAAKDIPPR